MLKKLNFYEIKTTVVGLLLLVIAGLYMFYSEEIINILVFVLLGVGICLLFLPDTFIENLKKAIPIIFAKGTKEVDGE